MTSSKKLSTEDRILWGKVAATAKPLPGRMEALFDPGDLESKAEEQSPAKPLTSHAGTERAKSQPAPARKAEKQHHPLERPVKKKLAKGRLALEARIDLHGMIQSEAHGLLLSFLLRAHDRGLRHVLVITGKGASFGSDGALKRAVPLWFALPEFRALISSYEPAARAHGGDGAVYVRLAKPKAAGLLP